MVPSSTDGGAGRDGRSGGGLGDLNIQNVANPINGLYLGNLAWLCTEGPLQFEDENVAESEACENLLLLWAAVSIWVGREGTSRVSAIPPREEEEGPNRSGK